MTLSSMPLLLHHCPSVEVDGGGGKWVPRKEITAVQKRGLGTGEKEMKEERLGEEGRNKTLGWGKSKRKLIPKADDLLHKSISYLSF